MAGRLLCIAWVVLLGLVIGPVAKAAVVFANVNVVPMDREHVLRGHTVVVEGSRIKAMGPVGTVEHPDGSTVVDASGLYLLPGLAEMHGHVPPVAQGEALDRALQLFLSQGITTVRGMLGEPRHLALRDELARGERVGPRLFTSGPSLNGNSVTTTAEAVERVRAQKSLGYDHAKLHPGLSLEVFEALMAEAHAVGLVVVGHVSADVGIEAALRAGMACIEHFDDYIRGLVPADRPERTAPPGFFGLDVVLAADASRIPELVALTHAAGAAQSPTETLMVNLLGDTPTRELLAREEMAYVPRSQRIQWAGQRDNLRSADGFDAEAAARFLALRRQLLKAMHDGGVQIVLGSDAPQVFNVPGFSAHRELALMVDAGLSPFQALETGTTNVARHLGVDAHRGVVAEGMDADLVLLEADPLQDIANASRIRGVMVDGRWHDRDALDALLSRWRSAAGSDGVTQVQ